MVKKAGAFLCTVLLLLNLVVSVFAISSVCITSTSEQSNLFHGEILDIKTVVKNNPGIMGFRITVDYPADVLSLCNAEKGKLLNRGIYSDSISNSADGTFDILWSDTSDMKDTGELFRTVFTVKDNAKPGKYTVGFSFSQDDTFNEKWEDVNLELNDFVFTVKGEEASVKPAAIERIISIIKDYINRFISFIYSWFGVARG